MLYEKNGYACYAADFETTTWGAKDVEREGCMQNESQVWAYAITQVGNDEDEGVFVGNRIEDFLDNVRSLVYDKQKGINVYFHGLHFDGKFIIYELEKQGCKLALEEKEGKAPYLLSEKQLVEPNTYTYLATEGGKWYTISWLVSYTIDSKGRERKLLVRFTDSLKLLPFKLSMIANGLDTKHKKLSLDYTGEVQNIERKAGGYISPIDEAYIKHDVLILSEALSIMFDNDLTSLTIGACCMKEFKHMLYEDEFSEKTPDESSYLIREKFFRTLFPNISDTSYNYKCIPMSSTHKSQDDFIRKTYKGGLCITKKSIEGKILKEKGSSFDINASYSYVMHSNNGEPGEYGEGCYPTGMGYYFADHDWYLENEGVDLKDKRSGLEIYTDLKSTKSYDCYIFVHCRCSFNVKPNHQAFLKLTSDIDHFYRKADVVESSKALCDDEELDELYSYCEDKDVRMDIRDLYLTEDDLELFMEQYDFDDFEILEGYWYKTRTGLFDRYIDKWQNIKVEGKLNNNPVNATIAKLMLNNLSGKWGTKTQENLRMYNIAENGLLTGYNVRGASKEAVYVPISAAITSKGRGRLVRSIQANYDRFLYCDTDCMKLLGTEDPEGVMVDKYCLGAWKKECEWEEALYLRTKCYVEKINGKYDVTCSGMHARCKELLDSTMEGVAPKDGFYSDLEEEFYNEHKDEGISLLRYDLSIPGQLKQRTVKGGACLVPNNFRIVKAGI